MTKHPREPLWRRLSATLPMPLRLRRSTKSLMLIVLVLCGAALTCSTSQTPVQSNSSLGEIPGILTHATNNDVSAGIISPKELIAIGEQIFSASFNTLDGSGNTKIRLFTNDNEKLDLLARFNRISGPDANSCAGCHNQPITGGGGDNVANVFVLAHEFPNVNFDEGAGDSLEVLTLTTTGNERGTISMFGSGLIELLAREMTHELHIIRDAAIGKAQATKQSVTVKVHAKGVSFGKLTAWPDGLLDLSKIEGVDEDLIIKPFSQKGVYTSLREFTLDSMQLHHGLQGEERVGVDVDADSDGVANELTAADITAITLFQATLPLPVIANPDDKAIYSHAERGQELFGTIGCAVCHKPYLELHDPVYTEPNPYNPPGTQNVESPPSLYSVDLLAGNTSNAIEVTESGTYRVYAYTDLKRHNMGEILANETLEQRFVESPVWLTRKLWGIMSEPPFLHHGRATLLDEAIAAHGGEANQSQAEYLNLSEPDRIAVIEFLKTFRMP